MANEKVIPLKKEWDERWKGSDSSERLTILGKRMFVAKARIIKEVMSEIHVRSILEVGCGLGYTMQVFNDLGYDCMGIDISPEAVAVCRNKGFNSTVMNIEEMNEQYELVSSDGMLEHFLNFEPYAKHLMRVSRNYVLLIQPNHDSFFGKTLAYLSELLMGDKNVFEYNYRIKDFISIFETAGFKMIRNRPIFHDVFRLLLFKKEKMGDHQNK